MMEWGFAWDGGLSLAPAIVAIAVALFTRRVALSLGLGALFGALVASHGAPLNTGGRLLRYFGSALGLTHSGDGWAFQIDHLEITAFSLFVAATIGVIGASGGTRALIARVERFASSRRSTMLSTWLAGAVVFFDDYANCLVVGVAMGPLCDRYQVSREKLAYIVDSTAAPVASLALVSTWVGYEVGLIADVLPAEHAHLAFSVFVSSIPYRFYSIFTLAFVGLIAWTGRDFGPMRQAEQHAAHSEVSPPQLSHGRAWLAWFPIGLLVFGTLGWLLVDGWGTETLESAPVLLRFSQILGGANPYHAMLFGSVAAITAAIGSAVSTSELQVSDLPRVLWDGVSDVFKALVVLYMAWALSSAMEDTGAADTVLGLLSDGRIVPTTGVGDAMAAITQGALPLSMLPMVIFLLSAFTAFATGTSFGTMAIFIPLAVKLALSWTGEPLSELVLSSTAAVLAGAIFGDHASPISDTTILSAVGARVSLADHVRTQLPYALSAAGIAIVAGYLPYGLGLPVWTSLPLGVGCAYGVIRILGETP